jgi:hypothetical protein
MIYTRKMVTSTLEYKHVSKDEKRWKNGKNHAQTGLLGDLSSNDSTEKSDIFNDERS